MGLRVIRGRARFRHETRIERDGGQCRILDAAPLIEYHKQLRRSAEMAKPLSRTPLVSDQIRLDEYDPEGDSYVVFQEPRRGEQERIDRLMASSEITYADMGREVRQRDRIPPSVQESFWVAACLVECNIPDEDGKLLFKPGKTCVAKGKNLTGEVETGFMEVWKLLSGPLADEIVKKLGEFYPPFSWGRARED